MQHRAEGRRILHRSSRCMVEGRMNYHSVSVCAWVSAMVHVGALYTCPLCSMCGGVISTCAAASHLNTCSHAEVSLTSAAVADRGCLHRRLISRCGRCTIVQAAASPTYRGQLLRRPALALTMRDLQCNTGFKRGFSRSSPRRCRCLQWRSASARRCWWPAPARCTSAR